MVAVVNAVVACAALLSSVQPRTAVAEVDGQCTALVLPADGGSRDIYCDVIPHTVDLSRARGLTRLDVSKNGLTAIRLTSDENVTLSALDLSDNRIASACHVITGDAVTVAAVILSSNRIEEFSVCTGATNLTLSWNRVRRLNRADMVNASRLQALDLGHNLILWIDNDTFASTPALQWLDLRGNALTTMSERTLPSTALRYLDVSGNRGLDGSAVLLPFENLIELKIARNAQLAPVVLGSGPRLQALDASHANLTEVPVTPAPMLGSLVLAGNAIRAVNSGDLDAFPLLRLLNMSGNRIDTVEDDAFGRLYLLAVLDLSGNRLTAVPASLPDGLHTLDLSANRIRSLAVDDFASCGRLKRLNVRGNGLRHVQDLAFAPLLFLDVLDLSDNPITMITREMLTGPVRLTVLKLEGLTAARQTPAFPFTDTRYLRRLQLARSRHLAAILLNDTAVLSSMLQLEHLDLTGCAVTALPSRLAYCMPKMRTLVLDEPVECAGSSWLSDWLCDMWRASDDDSQQQQRQLLGPVQTELRLRNHRRPPSVAGWSPAENVRCTSDDGRVRPVLDDVQRCRAATVTTAATTSTSASPAATTVTPTTEQVVVAARLRAEDDAKNNKYAAAAAADAAPSAVPTNARPGAVVFACAAFALVLLACGTVWIGTRAHALGRLRWRQNAADVDYLQCIEIKSLESSHHHVERW